VTETLEPRTFVLSTREWQGQIVMMDCVVDLDEFGESLGIEVVGVRSRSEPLANALGHEPRSDLALRIAYDVDADALYIRRRDEFRSVAQKSGVAALILDKNGALLAVGVHYESS